MTKQEQLGMPRMKRFYVDFLMCDEHGGIVDQFACDKELFAETRQDVEARMMEEYRIKVEEFKKIPGCSFCHPHIEAFECGN